MAKATKFCCFLGLEHGLLIQLHLHQLPVFHGFLCCLSLVVLELALEIKSALNSEIFQLHIHHFSVSNDFLYSLSLVALELAL